MIIQNYLNKHGFEVFCPKAVLFDMDGVLYDSMPLHAVAWHEAMKTSGFEMSQMDAYMTEGARGTDTIRQMALRQTGCDIGEQRARGIYGLKTRIFHSMTPPPMMDGILDLMQRISQQGLSIGVVTGSGQRPLIERLLNDFRRFVTDDHVVTAYDVNRGKPWPEPYLTGLDKMGGLHPWEAIVVENAPLGVQAGVAARILTIAVNTGILPDETLTLAGADAILPSIRALCDNWDCYS